MGLEGRAEGHVQHLSGVELLEERADGGTAQDRQFRHPRGAAGDVVRVHVLRETLQGQLGDAPEQLGLMRAHHAQRLQVARARRLEVHEAARGGCRDRVDGELVGAGVEAQLVGAELGRDGRMAP